MKTSAKAAVRWFIFFAVGLMITGLILDADAAVTVSSLKSMDVEKIDSYQGMVRAIDALRAGVEKVRDQKNQLFDLQRQIVTTSGACVGHVVALHQNRKTKGSISKQHAKELLTDLRYILNRILNHNLSIISDLQEHHLDNMADPYAFFNSPAWQEPHTIASLASYWIGWNGYYISTFYETNRPEKREVLEEAVAAFSRAFIDFKEDAVITKSLFGRALCYKEQGDHERAARDIKHVKQKLGKDDELFLRCVYEEALISYQTGNLGPALRVLDNVQEDTPAREIPAPLLDGFNRLRAKILLASLEREKTDREAGSEPGDQKFFETFNRIKTLAEKNANLVGEFYRYVQTNANDLKQLSFDELGPTGVMAMGDYHFDHHHMEAALEHYLYLNTNVQNLPEEFRDDILFRTGSIYCKEKKWHKALPFLETLAKKHPRSKLMPQAAHLYYVAAANLYLTHSNAETYSKMITAAKCFLDRCPDCPDQSEAHFQLAKYYQLNNENESALREYARVKSDSPNYSLSRFYLIEAKVAALGRLTEKGMTDAKAAKTLYNEGLGLVKQYKNSEKTETIDTKSAKFRILLARLYSYGSTPDGLRVLKDFEKHFPAETQLHLAATELRLAFYHQENNAAAAKNELARFLTETVVDSDWYVFTQELGHKFYQKMRSIHRKELPQEFDHYAFLSLAVYHRLLDVCQEHRIYAKDADTVKLRIGEIYMAAGRMEDARKLYSAILKENPKSANAVYNLGIIYEAAGEWQKALTSWRHFSEGAKAGTTHWYEARYRTARAFVALGKRDKACAILKMTLVLHPDLGDAEMTRKYQELKATTCKEESP